MANDFHRPTRFPNERFEAYQGADDPAALSRAAHDTASALLSRVRASGETEVLDRLTAFTDEHGIDTVAELWAHATAHSLPGTLWRLYVIRGLITQDANSTAYIFRRGLEEDTTIDTAVAGPSIPTGPDEIQSLVDEILRGVFAGDFNVALDRAAAYCRIMARGCTALADSHDVAEPERAALLTRRALRYSQYSEDFLASGKLWRHGELD